MAYVRKARILKLRWAGDHDLAGLEVRVKSIPFGTLLFDLGPLIGGMALDDLEGDKLEQVMKAFHTLTDSIIDWNIEEEDEDGTKRPLPVTVDNLLSLDGAEIKGILEAWTEATATVSTPLEKPSSSGAMVLPPGIEESLRVEPLPNPLSSFVPN